MLRIFPILFVLALSACSDKPAPESQPPEVFVITAEEGSYRPQRSFNARIASRTDVDIVAQVSGRLIAVHFREGDLVESGEPLFDIDPAPFKAALNQAQAGLSQAKASQTNAQKNFARAGELIKQGFISQKEYDDLESSALAADAEVEAAKAQLERARVDLDYASIVAPSAGRVGRSAPAVGDIVGPDSGPLTTLVGLNDMEAVFQVPEATIIALRNNPDFSDDDIDVHLQLPDGNRYPEGGKISYISNRVDASSGTVEVRASIANPRDILRPGMYVQAKLQLAYDLTGLMLPQAAIQVDQRGTYVLVVTNDSMVTRKNLTTGERFGEEVQVVSGLDAGAQVIIRGIQKARPGQQVKTLPYTTVEDDSPPAEDGDQGVETTGQEG